MIFNTLDIIRKDMQVNGGLNVKPGNIGEILSSSVSTQGEEGQIIISLINIEENHVSRDPKNIIRTGSGISMKNPAINLNLTLLFTSTSAGYEQALGDIQNIISFIQQKPVFDLSNTTLLNKGIEKLILEMMSLNLEQLQQLWSMLGVKYHPSIVYKVRGVTIDSGAPDEGPLKDK